jgi:hypothetical protein
MVPPPTLELGMSDSIERAWALVREDWSSESRHKRFVEQCRSEMRLDLAAQKYREAIRDETHDYRGARIADAERRLRDVVLLAQAVALFPTPRPSRLRLALRALSRIAFALLLLLLVYLVAMRVLR